MQDRRDFLKKAAVVSVGASIFPNLLGCDPNEENVFKSPKGEVKYIPEVNSEPYFPREFYTEKALTGNVGQMDFTVGGAKYFAKFVDSNYDLVSGLEGRLYADFVSGKKLVTVSDPQRRYFPTIVDMTNANGRIQGRPTITTYSATEKDFGSDLLDLFVKKIRDGLPALDFDAMCSQPGMLYLGDWSFNNLKQLNTNLTKASSVVAMNFPNPVTTAIYSVFSGAGKVIDGIDFFIDGLNDLTPLNIDRNKQVPIYQIPNDSTSIFMNFAQNYSCRNQNGDINDLLPMHPENSWEYLGQDGMNYSFEVKGLKEVNGKDLLFTENVSGVQEYFGFYGKEFKQYGFKDPSIGNVFFDPPLRYGDDRINTGSQYKSSSKIIVEGKPEITGQVDSNFSCEKREQVVLSNLKPYGDCFKMNESVGISMSGNGGTAKTNYSADHWYAKNVGKVKSEIGGFTVELIDSEINTGSRTVPPRDMPSLVEKIREGINSLI